MQRALSRNLLGSVSISRSIRHVIVITLWSVLTACGGGGGGSSDSNGESSSQKPTEDTIAPSAPEFGATAISKKNVDSYTVSLFSAETNTTAHWKFVDASNNEISGETLLSSPAAISGVNLASLIDGPVIFSFYVQDAAGNKSTDRSDLLGKDTEAPSDYFINNAVAEINNDNQTSISFAIDTTVANIGSTYNYSFRDQGNNEVNGSGEVSDTHQNIGGINVAGLLAGNITLTLTLTDDNENTGLPDTLIVKKTSSNGLLLLSGTATFDYVPHNPFTNGLDYSSSSRRPIRGAEVRLLDASNILLQSTLTDENGEYGFGVLPNIDVRVRIRARLVSTGDSSWDFSVTDNTQGDATYAMQGSLSNSGVSDSIRDLHAASGWTGSRYTEARTAAPFAILDTVYDGIQMVMQADPGIDLPSAELRWSKNNSTASGNLSSGDISSSFYSPSSGNIYLLGAADNDTDEYDRHVIAHEWCHYLEDQFSRNDSIGGSHSSSDTLDLRVAFSEGFCNAFSAMQTANPVYRDSVGNNQAHGFSINMETNPTYKTGSYNEKSVGSIVYDIYDANPDGVDSVTTGFPAIYTTMIDPDLTNSAGFTSIYLFLDVLKKQFAINDPSVNTAINSLASYQNIVSIDEFGSGETNDAGESGLLPIYKNLTIGGAATSICSTNNFGTKNKLANIGFGLFTLPSSNTVSIEVSRASGDVNSNPDFIIRRSGAGIAISESSTLNSESLSSSLPAGTYLLEVYDASNRYSNTGKDVCFNVTIN